MKRIFAALFLLCVAACTQSSLVTGEGIKIASIANGLGISPAVTTPANVTLNAIVLSNNSFNSNNDNAAVGALTVTTSGGGFSGTLALATHAACASTNNSSFQVASGSNVETINGILPSDVTGSTYSICISATQAGATNSPLYQSFTITGVEVPGPSAALFENPYYTCSTNYYVATTGSNANNGTSVGTPWLTIAHADSVMAAGVCLNIAPGTYSDGNEAMAHGGSSATATGYAVYRCTTLDACNINTNGSTPKPFCAGDFCGGTYPNYIIFDGLVLTASPQTTGNGQGVSCYNGDTGTVANGCHHFWVINSEISGYGQSGIQLNDSDWVYAVHNTIFQNSHDNSAAQGSGISFATEKVVSGYTPTADDANNPRMGIYGPSSPFHIEIAWNVLYNNYFGGTSGNTDGNCVIRDENGNTVTYTQPSLVGFNIGYNCGGGGFHMFQTHDATVANNDSYNNYIDPDDTGTARGIIDDNGSGSASNTFLNNLSYAIPGSGSLAHNAAYLLNASTDTATTNLSFCATVPTGGCVQVFNSATFSCTTNKCNTNPNFVNVGNTSQGSESTQPVGTNFALSGGSAAIGYGTTATGLPSQYVDAGACSSLLASCP